MHRILIPYDGSEPAQRALRFALGLAASELKAELYLLTVEPEPAYYGEIAVYVRHDEAIAAAMAAAHRVQETAAPILEGASLPVHRHLRLGDAAETVSAVAEELSCDWIIMGTRGLGRLGSLLMGSVATKVLHLTRRPVTLVH